MLQGGNRAPTGGNVSEEDDDAVVGGTDKDGEPEVEWLGIEGFELAGDALVHGSLGVVAVLCLQFDLGELVRDLFAKQIALRFSSSEARRLRKVNSQSRLRLMTASVVASRT